MAYIILDEETTNIFEGVKFFGRDVFTIDRMGDSGVLGITNDSDKDFIQVFHEDLPKLIKALEVYLENVE